MKAARGSAGMGNRAGKWLRASLAGISLFALTRPAVAAQAGDLLYKVVGGTEITITGYAGSGGPLTLPSAIGGLPVTRIGASAFEGRAELTGVLTVPDNVVSIGRQAFEGCENLSGLTLGSGVQEILFGAFAQCSGLSGSLLLPESVTTIDLYAFYGCSGLTGNLIIPDAVTAIGAGAFAQCTKLTGLKLGSALVEIGGNAFGSCAGLEGVSIPDGVSQIAPHTFAGCANLTYVVVGGGVTYIGESPFNNCSKLTAICFKGDVPSLHASAFAGTTATLCYLQGHPGWTAATVGGRPTTVWLATALFNAGHGTPSYGSKVYAAGMPFGELPSATRLLYVLAGWRTDVSDYGSLVSVTSQVPYVAGGFQLYATWALPFQKVTFDSQGGGAVSPADKTVAYGAAYGALPTPARTGHTFTGWYLNPQGTGARMTDSSLVTALSNHTLYAKWSAKSVKVTFNGQGGTTPTDGMRVHYDAAYGTLPGSCRLGYAFGGWWTALNGTGQHITEGTVVSALADHTLYAKWTYDPNAAQSASAGVALSLQLPGAFAGATGITVKGLPKGLRYDAKTKAVTGVPTQPGSFAVTIAAKGIAVQPLTFAFEIAALPAWAWGVFTGEHSRYGTCSMTVSAQGRMTGRIAYAGTNFAFSVSSFAAGGTPATGFRIEGVAKAGKSSLALDLLLSQEGAPAPQTSGCAWGSYSDGADDVWMALWRDVWKEEPALLAPYVGYYTATMAGTGEYGSGYLTLTVDKNGGTKVAGKLADGTAFSTSSRLVLVGDEAYFAVAASPAAYKGGHAYGAILIRKPAVGKAYIDDTVYWRSNNPQATENFGAGFDRKVDLAGGWYDKLGNLYAYYKKVGLYPGVDAFAPIPTLTVGGVEHPAVWWRPGGMMISVVTNKTGVMTGLAAPKPNTPTDADDNGVWEYHAVQNAVALKIGLTRATGIFKGSFKAWFDYGATHTSKSLAYEGILTPVRADTGDAIAGRGFFLWPDKAVPAAPAKPYAFKWSYDFLLWCQ